jgi:hypothetical protein
MSNRSWARVEGEKWDLERRRKQAYIEELLTKVRRLETGPLKLNPNDWTGIFIRGDNAVGFALSLSNYLEDPNNTFAEADIEDLVKLLFSCQEGPDVKHAE